MISRILTGCMAMVLLCGVAMAQPSDSPSTKSGTSSKTGSPQSMERSTVEKFVGSVQAVDPAMMKLTVKNSKGMTMDFTLNSTASIHKGNAKSTLSEVKTGDRVTVSYTGTMESPMVQRVTVNNKKSSTDAANGASSSTGGSTGGSKGSDSSVQPSTSAIDGNYMGGSTGDSTGDNMDMSSDTRRMQ